LDEQIKPEVCLSLSHDGHDSMRGEIGEGVDREYDELDEEQHVVQSLLECLHLFEALHLEVPLALAAAETHVDAASLIKYYFVKFFRDGIKLFLLQPLSFNEHTESNFLSHRAKLFRTLNVTCSNDQSLY